VPGTAGVHVPASLTLESAAVPTDPTCGSRSGRASARPRVATAAGGAGTASSATATRSSKGVDVRGAPGHPSTSKPETPRWRPHPAVPPSTLTYPSTGTT